jgi:protein MpaA
LSVLTVQPKKGETVRKFPLVALLALVASAATAPAATAKAFGAIGAPAGVTVSGSPYRYVAIAPGRPDKLTVIEQIDRKGGRVHRWWYLRGGYYVPAIAADGRGGGLSTDGTTLVLGRFPSTHLPRRSRFAILKTGLYLRHPLRAGQHRPHHAFTRVGLRGDFSFHAISPDGSTVFLVHHLRPGHPGADEVRALDTTTGRLLPAPNRATGNFLAFTRTPRFPGNLVGRAGVAGRSLDGRPILLHQLGDPAIKNRVLVFGCIHGDECAANRIEPLGKGGCPDPQANIFLVHNLDPDGTALGTRLNGRGVDLNRNFPSGWRPIGARGDPQYAGPRPFSEPETRLAARIVRKLRPKVTIWFHQRYGNASLVRAWGQSAAAARRFARLAGLPFHLLPWPAGTAPNWQNHRFPDTSSFVVEFPRGQLPAAVLSRLSRAVDRLGREVGEDGSSRKR